MDYGHLRGVIGSPVAAHRRYCKPPENKGLMIDTKAAAKLLNVCEKTLWTMWNTGRMPAPIRIGRAVRWGYDELRAWVAAGCPPKDQWKWPR